MELLDAAMTKTYDVIATWYLAVIVGGVLILLAERHRSRAAPPEEDVRLAAARYRQHYGDRALEVIGDHMRAASFVPDGRHRRFLKRVTAELLASAASARNRTGPGKHD